MRIDVFVPAGLAQQRLHSAFRPRKGLLPSVDLHFCLSSSQVLERIAAGACDLAVVDPFANSGTQSSLEVNTTHLQEAAERGSVVVLSSVSPPPGTSRWGHLLAGFPIVLLQNYDDDPLTLRRAVATAAVRRALMVNREALSDLAGSGRTALLLVLLPQWPRPRGVTCLAHSFALSERGLRAMMQRNQLPSPRALRAASLMLEAHFLRRVGVMSRRAMALHLGYEDASSLTRAWSRFPASNRLSDECSDLVPFFRDLLGLDAAGPSSSAG